MVSVFALAGIRRVRFTGGEPLVRKDIVRLVGFGGAFTNLADILAVSSQNGSDVFINLGNGDALLLANTTIAQLTADDFQFL